MDRAKALDRALGVAREAAQEISRIYASTFDVEYKGEDDPITLADRAANTLICGELARAYPDVPIVAEESDPSTFERYADADAAWFVDPLDGTRDFVAKNGEFVVMIGLAEHGRATLGVLVCPELGRTFIGGEGVGAFEIVSGRRVPIRVSTTARLDESQIIVPRTPWSKDEDAVVAALHPRRVLRCGGAGIRAAKVACGEADGYVQPFYAGALWDACAAEAVVRAAGGEWTDARGRRIDYRRSTLANTEGLLGANPSLHAAVLEARARALTHSDTGARTSPTSEGRV